MSLSKDEPMSPLHCGWRLGLGVATALLAVCVREERTFAQEPTASGPQTLSPARAEAKSLWEAGRRTLIELGAPDQARDLFLSALEADSFYARPRFDLGVLAEVQEDWQMAAHWFEAYLRFDARSPWATRARVELERARRLIAQDATAGGLERRRYAAALEYARRLFAAGDMPTAVAEAERAAQIDNSRWEAFVLAAAVYLRQGQWHQAANFLDSAAARGKHPGVLALRDSIQPYLSPTEGNVENVDSAASGSGGVQDSDAESQADSVGSESTHQQSLELFLPGVSRDHLAAAVREAVSQARLGNTPGESFPEVPIAGGKNFPDGDAMYRITEGYRLQDNGYLWVGRADSYRSVAYVITPVTGHTGELLPDVLDVLQATLSGWARSAGTTTDGTPYVHFVTPTPPNVRVEVYDFPSRLMLEIKRR